MENYLYLYIPRDFLYLKDTKKILYKNKILKTDYLMKIINDLIIKIIYNDIPDNKVNLWSLILKENYGIYYNFYIDYLIENNFMKLFSNYYTLKKSKTYIINDDYIKDLIKVKISDNILLKKHNKTTFYKFITDSENSPIPITIQQRLRQDLYKVDIDHFNAIKYIEELKRNNKINTHKYIKNIFSLNNIYNKNLYFIPDEYGRIHTNFTILKKEIRKNYLTIDNLPVSEIDIRNSQPLFLAKLLINNNIDRNNVEYKNYISLVSNGIIYEYFLDRYGELFIDRNEIKMMLYKVIYGKNNDKNKINLLFKNSFPNIYQFIKKYKEDNKSHKSISHILQKMESEFLFNNVIKEIYDVYPNINIITIHDSIIYPVKYDKEIKIIFNKHLNKLKKELF